jgi:hypothetical protein
VRGMSGPVAPQRQPVRTATVAIEPVNARQMHLAAFTGIGIVLLLGAIFYLGTDSLRGSLTDGGLRRVEVTITEAGAFDPDSVALRPGDELVIINENPEPQVLKSNTDSDLFVSQLLFDEPFSFVVPASALGKTYVYASATLPEDKTLEIRVVETLEQPAESSSSSSEEALIPLPPDTSSSESPLPDASSESSESSSIPVVQASSTPGQGVVVTMPSSSSRPGTIHQQGGNPTTFSLRPAAGESSSSSSSLPSLTGNQGNLPSNPYTVGNRLEAERAGLITKSFAKSSSSSSLHSGADLRPPVRTTTTTVPKVTKPRTNVETGPGPSMAIVTVLAMGLMALVYRKMIGAAI